MNLRKLGRTAVRVSAVSLGTVNIGWLSDDEESFTMMDRAVDAGINLFDTSDNYNAGATEETIGRWLARDSDRRSRIVLASKVYSPPMAWSSKDVRERMGAHVGPNDRGLSALHIRRACEDSLRRLGTDYIDLYQMHHVDRSAAWDEVWQAFEILVAQGKILYVGSSNFAGWHVAQAAETARARGFLGPVSEQSVYNLANRWVELEVLPSCEAYGVGFLAYSPLAAGALAGGASQGEGRRRRAAHAGMKPDVQERVARFETFCAELGEPPADVATAWLLGRPGVTSVISGPRTRDQLESSIRAASLELDEDTRKRLEDVFPGTGGAAPEAYAW